MDVRTESFLSSIWVPRYAIGVPLQTYTIWHQVRLKASNNAFVADLELPKELRRVPGFEDLIEAAFVCSRTWEQAQRDVRSPFLPLKMWRWGRRAGKFDVVAEILRLQDYISEQNQEPDINRRLTDTPPIGAVSPMENRLRLWLLKEGLANSQSEAWNYPFKLALIDYATVEEMAGRTEFFSERDAELMRVAKELEQQEHTE